MGNTELPNGLARTFSYISKIHTIRLSYENWTIFVFDVVNPYKVSENKT